ncbi:MAG: type II toxin-antitoxin system Phd/YefM family antitoxin [Opitutales bacterium]
MTTLKLSEAKAHLGKYTQKAVNGESFIIANRNRPLAKLVPIEDDHRGICPKTGLLRGQCRIAEDFDAPLHDFEASYYGE